MGWDAYAVIDGGALLLDVPQFRVAELWVKAVAGSVDGGLRNGCLDCSSCATALQEATGRSPWDTQGWTPELVCELNATADWSRVTQEPWARESACAFLKVCAELGTAITFDW